MKTVFILSGLLWVLYPLTTHAQLLPHLQPEQDACNALRLCGNNFTTPYSYQGTGGTLELYGSPCGAGEANSVWIRLEVSTAGNIVFTITPVSPEDDYDFAVLDLTGDTCADIMPTQVIRCNFNNNHPGSNVNGVIGMNTTSTLPHVGAGTFGNSFCQHIDANAGDVYLVMINNFGNYVTGGVSQGFTIDFTGSTASFVDEGPPAYDSLSDIPCHTVSSVTVFLDKPVLCSSIAADGSDFQLSSTASIAAATGLNCNGGFGYTQEIELTFSSPVPAGLYTLSPSIGSDGNTLIGLCGSAQSLQDSIALFVAGPVIELASDTTTCVGDSVQLFAQVGGSGIVGSQVQWTPATFLNDANSLNPVATPEHAITYVLTVTPDNQPECATSDSIRVHVLQGFDLLNQDTAICIGGEVPMQVQGDNGYQYSWSPATGLSNPLIPDPIAQPEASTTYTVTASYPGCTDSTQSVRVTVDTAVPGYLNFQADRMAICLGESIRFEPHTDVSPQSMAWDFGDSNQVIANGQPVQHAYEQPGTFGVTMTSRFLACPDTSFTDSITVYPLPRVDLGPDSSICLQGRPLYLKNLHNAPLTPYHQVWSTGDTTAILKVLHPGLYTLSVSTEPVGCTTTESIEIKKDCYIDIPNAFTPNDDGRNDYFLPRQLLSESVRHFQMRVFNRWGRLVFETTSLGGRGWNGQFNHKAQPMGVYLYNLSVDFTDGRQEQYEGNVTLIR